RKAILSKRDCHRSKRGELDSATELQRIRVYRSACARARLARWWNHVVYAGERNLEARRDDGRKPCSCFPEGPAEGMGAGRQGVHRGRGNGSRHTGPHGELACERRRKEPVAALTSDRRCRRGLVDQRPLAGRLVACGWATLHHEARWERPQAAY